MSESDVLRLEREVEGARARLAQDLSTLCAPQTFSDFSAGLKQEAGSAKDALIDQVRDAAQTRVAGFIDDLKARAAENPAAVLAIGAGLAWRFVRHPPIATALVGAGLYSLMRSGASVQPGRSDADYVAHAKDRLRQQASEVAATVSDQAGAAAESVAGTVRQWTAEASARAADLASQAKDVAKDAALAARDRVAQAGEAAWQAAALAGDAADDTAERIEAMTRRAGDPAGRSVAAMQATAADFRRTLARPDVTDSLLLGAAGVAVAAALGIALQRRNEPAEVE